MRRDLWWRLSMMMALVYAVMGSWYPLLAVHLDDLGLSGRARGWIFATLSLGAVAAPLGMGRLADRRVPIERLLCRVYLVGAIFLAILASGRVVSAVPLFVLFLIYWMIVAPALGLSSTMALRNLTQPSHQFGGVRAMGTVGWMVAGWLSAGAMFWTGTGSSGQGAEEAFWLAAGLSLAMAGFAAFGLPHTPPLKRAEDAPSGADVKEALRVLRRPEVFWYLVTAFGVTLTIPYMYQVIPNYLESRGLGRSWIAPAMSLGQIPEILGLFLLPRLLARLGFAKTMAVGILAWILRYLTLVIDPPLWLAIAGIPLHGVGIACFTITGQMYLDRQAPPDRRAEAQGLHVVLTTGAASLLGSLMAGEAAASSSATALHLFGLPLAIAVAGLILWLGVASRWADQPRADDQRSATSPARPLRSRDYTAVDAESGQPG